MENKGVFVLKIFPMIILFLNLVSCKPTGYTDISGEHNEIIGLRYTSQVPVIAHGISLENGSRRVDFVVLAPPPGFSGPGTVYRKKWKEGIITKVIGVFSNQGLISNQIYYRVEVLNATDCKNEPIFIPVTQDMTDNNRGLPGEVFKLE